MKINRLEIDNFMPIGQATVDLSDQGLVLVQGENLDDSSQNSNGAGKSTIVEALDWCIYNETARGDTGDAVINRTVGKNCRVMTQIVDDDKVYNIIRHRKDKENKNKVLLLDVTDPMDVIDLTQASDKATQQAIIKIIGCSSDVFRAAIYSGQEGQIDLPSQTDKFLKAIIEEAAGIDKMQAAHVIAKAELATVQVTYDNVNRRDDELKRALITAKETLVSMEKKDVIYEAGRAEKIDDGKRAVRAAVVLIKSDKVTLAATDKDALLNDLAASKSKIDAVDSEQREKAALEHNITEATATIKIYHRSFEDSTAQIVKAKAALASVDHEIGTDCHACGHTITADDLVGRKAAIIAEAKEFATQAKATKDSITRLRESRVESRNALKKFTDSMTDVSSEMVIQSDLQDEINVLEILQIKIDHETADVLTARDQLDAVVAENSPYFELIENSKISIRDIKHTKKENFDKGVKLVEEIEICKSVVSVFAPAGLRSHILDTVTPFLNDRTARYLSILSDGNITAMWTTLTKTAKGELREKFSIEVESATGGDSYRSLSGGEKRKVRLATSLALQDLVSSRASKPIELWIGDEIDDAVDEAGLERLMTVLEEKAKEKGTVLIISHNNIADWVRQHATVTKKDGRAYITGSIAIERDEEVI